MNWDLLGSHQATVLRLLLEVFQRGLGFVFQLVEVNVLDVGQLAQHRLLVLLLLVVLSNHLGQFCGQHHVVPGLLDLGLIQLVLAVTNMDSMSLPGRSPSALTVVEHQRQHESQACIWRTVEHNSFTFGSRYFSLKWLRTVALSAFFWAKFASRSCLKERKQRFWGG